MGMRDVEWVEKEGKLVMIPKCLSCLKSPKTCGVDLANVLIEKELPSGDPNSDKIVWCRHYDRVVTHK